MNHEIISHCVRQTSYEFACSVQHTVSEIIQTGTNSNLNLTLVMRGVQGPRK